MASTKHVGLRSVVRSEEIEDLIFYDVFRLHEIRIASSRLIALHAFLCFDNNKEIPDFTQYDNTYTCVQAITNKETPIGKKKQKVDVSDSLAVFYEHYPLNTDEYDFSNLSEHIKYVAKELARNIKVNVYHKYPKHVKKFVLAHFQSQLNATRNDQPTRTEIWRNIWTVINALICAKVPVQKKKSKPINPVFLSFLETHLPHFRTFLDKSKREECLLDVSEESAASIASKSGHLYLKTMIYMTRQVESLETVDFKPRLLQVFPQSSTTVPVNSEFDKRGLCATLGLPRSTDDAVWTHAFKTDSPQWRYGGKQKEMAFSGTIKTDGFNLSIIYRTPEDRKRQVQRQQNAVVALKRKRENDTNTLPTENTPKRFKSENATVRRIQRINLSLPKTKHEFQYIDTLTPGELQHLFPRMVYGDPNHGTLLEMISSYFQVDESTRNRREERMSYKKRFRQHELGQTRRSQLTKDRMQSTGLSHCNEKLSTVSSRTCTTSKYLTYLKTLFEVRQSEEHTEYYNSWWRYQKHRAYGLKQSHEAKFLISLEKKFGKDAVFVLGDHSIRCMKGVTPSMGVGLKRLIATKFKVFQIDEYGSSKYYWGTGKEGIQWYSKWATGNGELIPKSEREKYRSGGRGKGREINRLERAFKRVDGSLSDNQVRFVNSLRTRSVVRHGRRLHAVKQFTTAKGLPAVISRDINAVLNFRRIVLYMISHYGMRPPEFRRTFTVFGGPVD